jgi:hypothetical protein
MMKFCRRWAVASSRIWFLFGYGMLELRVSWPEILTNVKMALVILYLFTNSIRIFVEHDAIREVDVMVQPLNKCIRTIFLTTLASVDQVEKFYFITWHLLVKNARPCGIYSYTKRSHRQV